MFKNKNGAGEKTSQGNDKSDIATHTTADSIITETTTPSGTKIYSTPSGGPNSSKDSVVDVYVVVLLEVLNDIAVGSDSEVMAVLDKFHNR